MNKLSSIQEIISISGTYFKIIDQKSGRAVDVTWSRDIVLWSEHKGTNQKWSWGNKDKTILKNLRYRTKTLVLKPLGM